MESGIYSLVTHRDLVAVADLVGARAPGTRASAAACRRQSPGSVIAMHGLCCSTTCEIFPDQGLNPRPLLGRWILIHCTTRQVPK